MFFVRGGGQEESSFPIDTILLSMTGRKLRSEDTNTHDSKETSPEVRFFPNSFFCLQSRAFSRIRKTKTRTVPKEPTNPLVFESLRICIYIYICMHDHTYASMPIWLCLVFGGWHLCPSFSPGSGGYRVAMERTILVWLRESGRTNGAVEPHPSISLESGIPRVPFPGVALTGSQRDEEARFEGSPFASGQGSCGVVSKMEGSCNKWVMLPLVSL